MQVATGTVVNGKIAMEGDPLPPKAQPSRYLLVMRRKRSKCRLSKRWQKLAANDHLMLFSPAAAPE
jgi:hypothetical protein